MSPYLNIVPPRSPQILLSGRGTSGPPSVSDKTRKPRRERPNEKERERKLQFGHACTQVRGAKVNAPCTRRGAPSVVSSSSPLQECRRCASAVCSVARRVTRPEASLISRASFDQEAPAGVCVSPADGYTRHGGQAPGADGRRLFSGWVPRAVIVSGSQFSSRERPSDSVVFEKCDAEDRCASTFLFPGVEGRVQPLEKHAGIGGGRSKRFHRGRKAWDRKRTLRPREKTLGSEEVGSYDRGRIGLGSKESLRSQEETLGSEEVGSFDRGREQLGSKGDLLRRRRWDQERPEASIAGDDVRIRRGRKLRSQGTTFGSGEAN